MTGFGLNDFARFFWYIYTVVQWGSNRLNRDNGLLVDGKEEHTIKMTVSWLYNIKKVLLTEDEG